MTEIATYKEDGGKTVFIYEINALDTTSEKPSRRMVIFREIDQPLICVMEKDEFFKRFKRI